VPIDTQYRKQKKALLHRMFSVSAPDDPKNSVRNFRIRTYARFRNHAQAQSLATVHDRHPGRLYGFR
jgi:hypothetical protein